MKTITHTAEIMNNDSYSIDYECRLETSSSVRTGGKRMQF